MSHGVEGSVIRSAVGGTLPFEMVLNQCQKEGVGGTAGSSPSLSLCRCKPAGVPHLRQQKPIPLSQKHGVKTGPWLLVACEGCTAHPLWDVLCGWTCCQAMPAALSEAAPRLAWAALAVLSFGMAMSGHRVQIGLYWSIKMLLRALVVTFCLDDVLKRWALNSGVASPEGNLATNAGGDRSIQRHAWTTWGLRVFSPIYVLVSVDWKRLTFYLPCGLGAESEDLGTRAHSRVTVCQLIPGNSAWQTRGVLWMRHSGPAADSGI